MRYNLYRSAQINAAAAPGYSSAQAMKALEEVFSQTMPSDMGFDYLGMSFQEQKAQQGVPPVAIFALSLLFVFLILAGAVRELVAAVQRTARHTYSCLRRVCGTAPARDAIQHLRPNRSHSSYWPGS